MATRKSKDDKQRSPFGDISKENPRTLERVSDGAKTRVTDPLEFMSLTTAHGYRDVTGGSGSSRKGSSGGSSNAGTGSGNPPASDNTTSK